MKRGLIFIAVFLLAISMVAAADDVILKLSSATNAHGEVASGTSYTTEIKYSDIFGGEYSGTDAYTCNGNNIVLRLSADTNAHAQDPAGGDYTTEVCFGDLQCALYDPMDTIPTGAECVVKLSSEINAHLETCASSNYDYSIYCTSLGGAPPTPDCEEATNKIDCWAIQDRNCTWTPPGTHSNPEGGCCPDGSRWNPTVEACQGTANLCNNVWLPTPEGQVEGVTWKKDGDNYQYCAQVTSGLSYGFWYDINKF